MPAYATDLPRPSESALTCCVKSLAAMNVDMAFPYWNMRKLSRKFYSRELSVSTEPEENTDPDKYPAVFRMKPEQLAISRSLRVSHRPAAVWRLKVPSMLI